MNQKPKYFNYLTCFLIMVALLLPIQIMVLFGHHSSELSSILVKMAPLNWAVFFLALAGAFLSYRASPILMFVIPIFLFVVAWNNWLIGSVGVNYSLFATTLATLLVVGVHIFIFEKSTFAVLKNSNLRWWLVPRRKKAELNTFIRPVTGGDFASKTFDISTTGAFIRMESYFKNPTGGLKDKFDLDEIGIGSRCAIQLALDQMRVVRCSAEVVRKGEGDKSHPKGFAVKFVGLSKLDRRVLSSFLEEFKESNEAHRVAA